MHASHSRLCAVRKASEADKEALLSKVDCFIFDCDGRFFFCCFSCLPAPSIGLMCGVSRHHLDLLAFAECARQKSTTPLAGVIWRGDSVIEGVPETLDALRALVMR